MTTKNTRVSALIFSATIGALLAFPFQVLWWAAIDGLMAPIDSITPAAGSVLGYLFLFAVGGALLRWLAPKMGHFREFFRHPPAIAAGLFGYVGFVVFLGLVLSANALEWFLLSWPLVPAIIGVALRCRTKRSPVLVTQAVHSAEPLAQLAQIEAWLSGEDPIRDASRDLVGMRRRASRLVVFLQQRREGAEALARTLAIRGSYGSGKTSLTYLIEQEAPKERGAMRLIFARTNCWGFEDAKRAQEHILRQCVERLTEFVDTTALRSLPKHYVEAIGETPFKPFGILLGEPPDPIDLLQQFSHSSRRLTRDSS
jgi:hypothetical protein